MKSFLFLLLATAANAADWTLPAANQAQWLPGTHVGVVGGVDQYRAGGASDRTTIINVKHSPYFAAGNNNETTGAITSGSPALVVASAAGFAAGNYITYGTVGVSSLTLTAGATYTDTLRVYVGVIGTQVSADVAVTAGETATQVATKIRAASFGNGRITAGGSGTTVIFTQPNNGLVTYGNEVRAGTGVTATTATLTTGTSNAARISSVAGNTLTLDGNAPEALTGALVQHDDSPAIQSALNATEASTNTVLYFPGDSTYRISNAIAVDLWDSNKTIRGDGASTIFYGSGGALAMFSFQGGNPPTEDAQVVAGTKTKGTTALSVASSAAYGVGDIVALVVENEENNTRILAGAAPTWNHSAFLNMRNVLCKVTAVSTGVVTVDPPLCWDCTNYTTTIYRSPNNWAIRKMGWEDFSLTFDAAAPPLYGINTARCDECWFYNITTPDWFRNGANGSVIYLTAAYKAEVRRCDFRTLSPLLAGDDGALQFSATSKCLIIDNIFHGWDSGVYNSGASYGDLIAYNFLGEGDNYPGHNGHNSLELYEGNVGWDLHFDAYHGSNSHMTVYRNWLYRGLFLKRFQYYMVSAGNVMGRPGVEDHGNAYGYPHIGNAAYTGNANHFTGDPHADWGITGTLTTRTGDGAGVFTAVGGDWATSTAGPDVSYLSMRWAGGKRHQMPITGRSGQVITFSGGSGDVLPTAGTAIAWGAVFGGYNEFDDGVAYTLTRAENFLALQAGGGSLENATADTLPNSLAYTSQPAWWTADSFTGTWPPIDPNSPTYSVEIIPAGYRFANGASPPPSGGSGGAWSGGSATAGAVSVGD